MTRIAKYLKLRSDRASAIATMGLQHLHRGVRIWRLTSGSITPLRRDDVATTGHIDKALRTYDLFREDVAKHNMNIETTLRFGIATIRKIGWLQKDLQ